MNVLKLHGKIGENEGIVFVRNKYDINESTMWRVEFNKDEPTNLNKAKLVFQIR